MSSKKTITSSLLPSLHTYHKWSQDISVSILTTLWAGQGRNFSLSTTSKLSLCSTHSPLYWVLATLCSRVKQLRHEVDHLPDSSAVVRHVWSHAVTPIRLLWHSAWLESVIHIFKQWMVIDLAKAQLYHNCSNA
jgi:hypothetical protein